MRFFSIFDHTAELVCALTQDKLEPCYLNAAAQRFVTQHGNQGLQTLYRLALTPDAQAGKLVRFNHADVKISVLEAKDEAGRAIWLLRSQTPHSQLPQPSAALDDDAAPAEVLDKVVPLDSPSAALYALLQDMGERYKIAFTGVYIVEHRTITHTVTRALTQAFSDDSQLHSNMLRSYLEQVLLNDQNCSLYIPQVENLKQLHPMEYALLTAFKLTNALIVPIKNSAQTIGFLSLFSIAPEKLSGLKRALRFYTTVAASLIKKRSVLINLLQLKERDDLTEAYNRRAFERAIMNFRFHKSIGALIVKLSPSAQQGSDFGLRNNDEQLKKVFQCLKTILTGYPIFRSRAEIFTVILKDVRAEQVNSFKLKAQALLKSMNCTAEVTAAFTTEPCSLNDFLNAQPKHNSSSKLLPSKPTIASIDRSEVTCSDHPFFYYIKHYRFDELTLLQSISLPGQPFCIYFGDLTQDVFYLSDNLCEIFGFTHNIVPNFLSRWRELIRDDRDRARWEDDIARTLSDPHYNHSLRYRVSSTLGHDIWVHCRGHVIFDEDKKPLFVSGSLLRLDDRNLIDPISNLQREYAAVNDVKRLIEDEHSCTIIALKLFSFSKINEQMGRETVNHLIHSIGQRLTDNLGDALNFYRLDGTTIIGISKSRDLDTEHALKVQMLKLTTSCYADYGLTTLRSAAITSIRYPEHLEHAKELFDQIACFVAIAKQSPDTFIEFSDHDVQAQRRQAELVLKITASVEHNFRGFSTVVQPLVESSGEHRILGAEILMRWNSDNLNIGPTAFIPILEQSKLIVQVGRFVFNQAAEFVNKARTFSPNFFISFNVSYVQIKEDPGFIDYIAQTLHRLQLPGKHFIAELTETNFDACPEKLTAFIEHCRELGIRIALDDFGNGYSSLNLLLKYPASIIKLDRSLTVKAHESKNNLYFIKAVITACHQLGRQVCVEGVETLQELQTIMQTDCDYIQGYYFYRPLKQQDLLSKIFLEQRMLMV